MNVLRKWWNDLAEPMLGPRSARLLLGFLLVLKLLVTTYNAVAYNQHTYDHKMHAMRARSGGLSMEGRAYNPPLYYLPALPYIELQKLRGAPEPTQDDLLTFLRWTNIGYLAVFYWCWTFVIFPALAGDYRSATLASLVLLAVPGYQKLAAASHPDNALACMSAVCMAAWLSLRRRHPPPAPDDRAARRRRAWAFVLLTVAAGLAGITRPFGVVPALVFLAALVVELARGRRLLSASFLVPACAVSMFVVVVAGSWLGYQRFVVGRMAKVYEKSYIQRFVPRRKNFDFVEYFASFHLRELLKRPNRDMPRTIETSSPPHSLRAPKTKPMVSSGSNSFFTLLYSETWGDHWLYFSGSEKKDYKIWPKRIALVAALPLLPLLAFRFVHGVWRSLRDWRPRRGEGLEPLVALGFLVIGTALYLYWQTGEGLLPGKNSTVKFLYVSFLVPFALVTCALPGLRRRSYNLWLFYLLTLFMAALPVAMFWQVSR
ncbi:MAG: hypothetical protein JW940_35575 [Polyangiaceae bacterium]|nr:hypothetical protein [Polyangiaceae bacterium]